MDATAALQHALGLAGAAGGGTVFFPRGTYFLSGLATFEVPPGVYLRGAGTSLVSIYVSEANRTKHRTALFVGIACRGQAACRGGANGVPEGLARWGLSDLTIYQTAYYYNVIEDSILGYACRHGPDPANWGCEPTVDGFTMLRVRI